MTHIFLALGSSWRRALGTTWPHEDEPLNALVTFADPHLLSSIDGVNFSRLMLDSGAFSAWNRGATIDMDALAEESKRPRYTEAVCLDVIGDADASVKNALAMKAAGSPAFPVFHYGDPWEHLELYKKEFGRVGLSCRFGEPVSLSMRWLDQCFARAWPCRFHSFGWTGAGPLSTFPFDTADSTSWMVPQMYGQWRSFGKGHRRHFGFPSPTTGIPTSGTLNLTGEVRSWLKIQRFLSYRWAKELAQCRGVTNDNA